MTYSQKLKDPRWQQKRLLILQRDGWKCFACGDTSKQLQVHHLIYRKCDPWDYPDECYQTLCVDCHELRQSITDQIANAVKMKIGVLPTTEMMIAGGGAVGQVEIQDPYRACMATALQEAYDRSDRDVGVIPKGLFEDAVGELIDTQCYEKDSHERLINLLISVVEHLKQK